jgi:phosphatidylglycerol lysyltransferase
LIVLPIGYIAACAIRREPIRIGRIIVPLPRPRLAVGQLVLSSLDWLLAASVLFVLLPDGALPFITFAGLFLISILIGMISHVPGGMGVFEGVMVLLLSPYLDSSAVLPALVVFRAIYFLAPLIIALVALVIDEAWQRRSHVVRAAARPAFAAMVLMLVATRRFIKDDAEASPAPSDADLDDAARIIAAQHATSPMLVFLRDKSLIFNEARTAFLMYAVQGRSWVVLGDPVGPPSTHTDLIRLFLNRCDESGGTPVFYEVGAARLHLYADFGLRFVKIGEAARVDLQNFTLETHAGYRHRQAYKRVEKAGATFRVLMPEDVVARLRELREVSDDWLAGRSTSEKGFSLGFFDEAYVARFPVAIIEKDGVIIAFANVWPGAGRGELSLDLMRHRHDAPSGIMESLVVHLMQWAQQHGYRQFVLGMAPLAGVEASPVASWWNRVGAFVYEYGEAIYNFQGLRAFKAKFHPEWEPHYLAYPGGLRLPRIMADVSALVAGGYSQIFRK